MLLEPAEDLPAGVVDPPPAHVRLGLGLVLPVIKAVPDRDGQRRRHVDEDVPAVVGAPRLEHEHLGRPVRRLSRLASAHPAEPPPTMMKSYRSRNSRTSRHRALLVDPEDQGMISGLPSCLTGQMVVCFSGAR